MNKLKILTLLFVASWAFYSCKPMQDQGNIDQQQQSVEDDKDNIEVAIGQNSFLDSLFKLSCNNVSVSLERSQLNWHDIPVELTRCLYTEGFNGSQEANTQIAMLIDLLGHHFVRIFGNEVHYRGPEIFEALLKQADKSNKRTAHLYYAKKMIKTIGDYSGEDTDKYVRKITGWPDQISVIGKGTTKGDPAWNKLYLERRTSCSKRLRKNRQ